MSSANFKSYVKALLRDVSSSRDEEEKQDALHSLFCVLSNDKKKFLRELPGTSRTFLMELLKKCSQQDSSFKSYYDKLTIPSFC